MRRTLCLTTLTVAGVLVAVVANEARQDRFRIDADNTNGSATEFASTLQNAVDTIENVDIIPGHADDPLAWDDLVDYAAFYSDVLTRAQEGAAAGRSVAETAAAYSVPEEFSDFQAPANRVEQIIGLIYEGR